MKARRKPTGPDTLSPFGPGSGRFLFLQVGQVGLSSFYCAQWELLKVPNASGKAAFRKSFVCMDICGHDCRWW